VSSVLTYPTMRWLLRRCHQDDVPNDDQIHDRTSE
jgi:hypothetical protein